MSFDLALRIYRLLGLQERAEFDRIASRSIVDAIDYGRCFCSRSLEGLDSLMEMAARVRQMLDGDALRNFDDRAEVEFGLVYAIKTALLDLGIAIERWPSIALPGSHGATPIEQANVEPG